MPKSNSSVIVKVGRSFGSGRTDYISRTNVKVDETVKDETAARPSRYIFSRQKNDFLLGNATAYLDGGEGFDRVREIIVATRYFEELGETGAEREFFLRGAVRESMKNLLGDIGHKNAPWVAAIHRNTPYTHVHILVAEQYRDANGSIQFLPNKFPKELFAVERGETALSRIFKSELEKRVLELAPVESEIKFLGDGDAGNAPDEGATGDSKFGTADEGASGFRSLVENNFISAETASRIVGKTLFFDAQGNAVFVKRNADREAVGKYTLLSDGDVSGENFSADEGIFYTGSLDTAKKIVLVDSPLEALSLETWASGRNLKDVAFVALNESGVQDSLIKEIERNAALSGGDLRVIWSRGNSSEDGRRVQNLDGFEELSVQLSEFCAVKDIPQIETIKFAPGAANSWQDSLYLKQTSERFGQARNLTQPVAARELYYPARPRLATGDELQANHTFPIGQIQTLPAEPDVLDGTRAYNQKLEKIQSSAAPVLQIPQAIENRRNENNSKNRLENFKRETEEIRNLPLDWVAQANGLYRQKSRGTDVWTDAAADYKIKISGHIYDDYKNRKNDYLPNLYRAGAISLQIHLSGGQMDFRAAREFLKETFITGERKIKPTELPKDLGSELKIVPLELNLDPSKSDVARDYLENARGIKPETVRLSVENGSIAASGADNVSFLLRDLEGHIIGDAWRSVAEGSSSRGNSKGTYKELGWFYLGNPKDATEIVLTEAPVEALSYYDLQPEKDWSKAAVLSMNGVSAGARLEEFLIASKSLKTVVIALNNDVPGQRAAARIAEKLIAARPELLIENEIPASGSDWNELIENVAQANQKELPEITIDPTDVTETAGDLFDELERHDFELPAGELVQPIAEQALDLISATPAPGANVIESIEADEEEPETSDIAEGYSETETSEAELESVAAGNSADITNWHETGKKGWEVTREEFYAAPHLVRQTSASYPDVFLRDRAAVQLRASSPDKYRMHIIGAGANLADLTNPKLAADILIERRQELFDELNQAGSAVAEEQLENKIALVEQRIERVNDDRDNAEESNFTLKEVRDFELEQSARTLFYDGVLINQEAVIWNRENLIDAGEYNHSLQIESAVKNGELIEREVLADYPELVEGIETNVPVLQNMETAKNDDTASAAQIFADTEAVYEDEIDYGGYVQDKAEENAAARPAEPESVKAGTKTLADEIRAALHQGEMLGNNIVFNRLAEKHFQGTIAGGQFTSKDAYDALELGVNGYLMDSAKRLVEQDPRASLQELRELLKKLPTQTNRTDEQIKFQQFSTPPTEAFIAFLATGATVSDRITEPSAGTGGLAAFALGNGITTHVNEISPRRAAMLEMLGFQNVTSVDAQFLNDTLPKEIRPTVILMNPPFSATGGRTANNRTIYGAEHITDALARLEEGGRLVAIVGEGMDFGKPTFAGWWTTVLNKYTVRANIAVPGEEYAKYGTSFGNQLLVIDKTGATPGGSVAEKLEQVARGNRANLEAVLEDVLTLRSMRPNQTQSVLLNTTTGLQAETKENEVQENGTISSNNESGERQPSVGIDFSDSLGSQPGRTRISKNTTESNRNDTRQLGLFDLFNDADEPGKSSFDAETGKPAISVSSDYAVAGASDFAGAENRTNGNGGEPSQSASGSFNQLDKEAAAIETEPEESSIVLGTNKNRRETVGDGSVRYSPSKLTGGVEHPGDIVESASMAAVVPPDISYAPRLDPRIINEGNLSSLQYEAVVYAGQRHEQILPTGARAGFFIGDGTGVGKGRELAGIALDNWNQGRKRVLWMSINYDLVPSTKRDLKDLGAGEDVKLATLDRFAPQSNLDETVGDSVLFASYSTLIGKGKDGSSRFDQIAKWLGEDGVIMFDEGHLAKNAVSEVKASQRGEAVVDLQIGEKSNPNWRFVYSSATGATTVQNMGYMQRLGLWGDGTGFPGGFVEFQNKIERGGVGAMEMVARDMKAAGMYTSRSLSYRGVDYAQVHHELTTEQVDIYNTAASAWAEVAKNIDAALDSTNGDSKARRFAYSRFWSSQQLFFRQLLTAMKVPSLISEVENRLENGSVYTNSLTGETETLPAQIVIGVIGTGEARTKEQMARAAELGLDLDELDFSPKQVLTNLVEKAFPVNRYTEATDPLTGKTRKVILTDESGVPIQSAEAVAMRDALLAELNEKLHLPDNPLDQIINHFGEGVVAEITGRDKRIIEDPETGQRRYVRRAREGVAMDKASQDEMDAFQAGRKRIAVISQSASTGISLHADARSGSADARRVHMTLETAWSADTQMQTFGRTHRSNETVPPEYVLLSTNLGGEKRFLSTIAKRLSTLGALTKGDRDQAGGGNLLQYDFENHYGDTAAKAIVKRLNGGSRELLGELPPDPRTGEIRHGTDILYTMGIARYNKDGFLEVPNKTIEDLRVTTFLNRTLILDVDTQNALFDSFTKEMERIIKHDKDLGLFDEGVTDIKGENIRLAAPAKTVATDKTTGAETKYCQIQADVQTAPVSLEEIGERNRTITIGGKSVELTARSGAFYQQIHSKNIIYAEHLTTRTDAATGTLEKLYRFARPAEWQERLLSETELVEKYRPVTLDQTADFGSKDETDLKKVKNWWQAEFEKVPRFETRTEHIIAGAVLPVWQRLSTTNDKGDAMSLKTVRVETEDGERIVGVRIPPMQIGRVLRDLGVEQSFKTPEEIFKGILETGERVELVGGLKLGRMFIKRQPAIELQNLSKYQGAEMEAFGASKEIINFSAKYFIPNNEEKAIPVLSRLLERYPAVSEAAAATTTIDAPEIKIRPVAPIDRMQNSLRGGGDSSSGDNNDGAGDTGSESKNETGTSENLPANRQPVPETEEDRNIRLEASRNQAAAMRLKLEKLYAGKFGQTDAKDAPELTFGAGVGADVLDAETLQRAARRAITQNALDEVFNLKLSELLDKAEINFEAEKSAVRASAAGMEVVRQFYDGLRYKGILNYGNGEASRGTAMMHTPEISGVMLGEFEKVGSQLQAAGYSAGHQEKFAAVVETYRHASRAEKYPVFYIDEQDLDHELFHQASWKGQPNEEIKHGDLQSLIEHPVYQKAVANYVGSAYGEKTDERKVEEVAAFLAGGDKHLLMVTQSESDSYLKAWFVSYAETNGAEKLKLFSERSNEDVKRVIESAREQIKQSGQVAPEQLWSDTAVQSIAGVLRTNDGLADAGENQLRGISEAPQIRVFGIGDGQAQERAGRKLGSEALDNQSLVGVEDEQNLGSRRYSSRETKMNTNTGLQTKEEQINLPAPAPINIYTELRLALEKSRSDGNRFRLTQDKQIVWTDAENPIVEKTNASALRERLSRVAEKKVDNLVEAVAKLQDKVDERFQLPIASIRRIYADRQYEREARRAAPVLDKIETGTVEETNQSNMETRFQLLNKKLKGLEEHESMGAPLPARETSEILHHVKEFALESRSGEGFSQVNQLAENLPEDVRFAPYETGRTDALSRLLKQEACVAKKNELAFALRGKHERFFVTGDNGKLLARRDLTDYEKFFKTSAKDKTESREKAEAEAGKSRDVQRDGWSIVDVRDAHIELKQVVSNLSDIAKYQREKLDKHGEETATNLLNYFNPLTSVNSQLRLFTDPVGYVSFQLNPIAQFEAHPLVQLISAWQKEKLLSEQLKITEKGLETAGDKLQTLSEQIKPKVEAAFEERCETLTDKVNNLREFAASAGKAAEAGKEILETKGITNIKPVWRDGELTQVGEAAIEVGSVEGLLEYHNEQFRLNSERGDILDLLKSDAVKVQLKDFGKPGEQLADHLHEMNEEPVSINLQNKLEAAGFEKEAVAGMTRLEGEMAHANSKGEIEDWWEKQSDAAMDREILLSENDCWRHAQGQRDVLRSKVNEWKNWRAEEFEPVVGKIYNEPLRIEPETGEAEFIELRSQFNSLDDSRISLGTERVEELADMTNQFVGRYETTDAFLEKLMTQNFQTEFGMQLAGQEIKLLTSGEVSTWNDAMANDPLEPFSSSGLEMPTLGSDELAGKLGNIETIDPIENDAIVASAGEEELTAKTISELSSEETEEIKDKLTVKEEAEEIAAAEVETVAASERTAVMMAI